MDDGNTGMSGLHVRSERRQRNFYKPSRPHPTYRRNLLARNLLLSSHLRVY